MNLTDKDLTLFTFTRDDDRNNTLLYKTCYDSWKRVLPNAKIIKFNMDKLKDQYKDIWFYQYLSRCRFVSNCFYTDFLRLQKSLEIPNSIYLDSDVYLPDSPLTDINSRNQPFIGTCDCYFNNGESDQIKKLYDFYTGKHSPETSAKVAATITDGELWPSLCDRVVWDILGFTYDYIGHRQHYYCFAKSNYILIKDATFDPIVWVDGFEEDEFNRAIVVKSNIESHWCYENGINVFRVPDFDFYKKVVIDYCNMYGKAFTIHEITLDQVKDFQWLSENDKNLILKYAHPIN